MRLIALIVLCVAILHCAWSQEQQVTLQSPLTTVVRITTTVPTTPWSRITATVTVPDDAPRDLGVGAFVVDQHGRWFQCTHPGPLIPGINKLEFDVSPTAALIPPSADDSWNAATAANVVDGGLFFWSTSASHATLTIVDLYAEPLVTSSSATEFFLHNLATDGAHATTGERWTLSVCPHPFPDNPFAEDQFALDALITTPDGATIAIPGYYDVPMQHVDRGDREVVTPSGAGRFVVRYRPQQPGSYKITVQARRGEHLVKHELPPLTVTGEPWDNYVRIDKEDPRFFAVNGAFWWPRGPNLRSVYDVRGSDRLNTILTPDRGLFAYEAYLARLAAHNVNAIEVWMSSWNLALEWRRDWPDFYGQGRYSLNNAWKLDQLLDMAWAHGMRVNLVIRNHGQASTNSDAEWDSNPYNRERGGTVDSARSFFTDPQALAGQQQLRRYIVARYADHPAIIGWKLWSEVNLTAGRGSMLRKWHEDASAAWKALDVYAHPITTHWCGDYNLVDRTIAAQPGIDYICIDAYHDTDRLLADVLWRSTMDPAPRRGLAQFGKPVLTTEYGGNWNACPKPQLLAEHHSGPWAALVSGHAGSPMLWWFEWLDQSEHFGVYGALEAFLKNEDMRGSTARSIVLAATSDQGSLWQRAWSRQGRLLGYLLDQRWGRQGGDGVVHTQATIQVGSNIAAGPMVVEWWNADTGEQLKVEQFNHPGGALVLQVPPFQRHLAYKLMRTSGG